MRIVQIRGAMHAEAACCAACRASPSAIALAPAFASAALVMCILAAVAALGRAE